MPIISVSGTHPSSDGGKIDINLSDNHNSTIRVKGSHQDTIRADEKLSLLAVGGNGLDGKIGANGHNGCPGTNGRDAGRYSRGEEGGPGGNGGHGGAGTHGGPAGNGGSVDVSVKYEDLALLDIISIINVSPGLPGKAGKHGIGGRGGRGGRGGSSYSWSEPYTVDRTEHWWDGQGNIHNRVISDTQYSYRHSPGGSDGPDGIDGGAYTYSLYPGAIGTIGKIQFHVSTNSAQSLHLEPYKLVTRNIFFQSTEGSGIWEPGDLVSGFYSVENTGTTMISPPESIPLILENQQHLELVQTGTVAGSIKAGSAHLSEPTPLQFRIKEPLIHAKSEPYTLTASVNVAARNTRLNQAFQHSHTSDLLTIQYPALLEPQTNHFSIGEHESHVLRATVKNIGAKALGKLAGRELLVEITSVKPKASLVSEHISLLESQKKHQIQYREQFDPGTEFGEHQTYHMSLYLQPIHRGDRKTLIQRQTIIGQFTPKYSPPTNKFILVINGNTTKEQIRYWTNFLGSLSGNHEISIWNTSYYQQLNLDGHPNLLEDAANGTIIMLDDVFPNEGNNLQHNTQHISKEQLLNAAQKYNVSFVAVGNNVLPQPYTSADFISWSDPRVEHESLTYLMAKLLHENMAQPIVLHQVTIPLYQRWFCRGRERAEEALSLVIDQLNKVFPNRSYHISIAYTDEQYVTLNIRRLADASEQNVHPISLSNEQLAQPLNHHGVIQTGLLAALSFAQKFDLFMQKSNPYHQQLAQALTKDLLDEQAKVLQTEAYGSLLQRILRTNQRDFSLELKRLSQLLNLLRQFEHRGDFEKVQAWSPLIIRLIAEVQYHAQQHSSFWTRFLHWFLPQTNEQIIESTHRLCDEILGVQSDHTDTPIEEIKASVQRQGEILKLADQLSRFLQEDDDIDSEQRFSFFNHVKMSAMERQTVQQLLLVCKQDAALDTLDIYKQTMKNTKLERFSARFAQLFPDFEPEVMSLYPTL